MLHEMIVYGTRVYSDIAFPLDLPLSAYTRFELMLSASGKESVMPDITCGTPLYRAHGRQVYLYSDRAFDSVSQSTQPWLYEIEGVGSFFWRGGAERIYYDFGKTPDTALLSFWFIHLLLPLYFALEEKYELFHGGAVRIGKRSVMFCAPSMGGKSTLTDYFVQKGHTLISDDKIPLWIEKSRFMLTGSHPYHRPYRKFEELGYRVAHFMTETAPLDVMYILEKGDPESRVTIDEIRGFEKFNAMLPHYLYGFAFLKRKRMNYLSKLLSHVRVFRVTRPWDLHRQNEVYDTICIHAHTL